MQNIQKEFSHFFNLSKKFEGLRNNLFCWQTKKDFVLLFYWVREKGRRRSVQSREQRVTLQVRIDIFRPFYSYLNEKYTHFLNCKRNNQNYFSLSSFMKWNIAKSQHTDLDSAIPSVEESWRKTICRPVFHLDKSCLWRTEST